MFKCGFLELECNEINPVLWKHCFGNRVSVELEQGETADRGMRLLLGLGKI